MGSDDSRPATLADLLEYRFNLTAHCLDCLHFADIEALALAVALGERFPVPAVSGRLRCRRCGSRNATVRLSNPRAPFSPGWRRQ